MPDESCRTCGGTLKKCSLCAECRKAIQQICTRCGLKTIEQLHADCFYGIESIQKMHNFLLSSHDLIPA
jgi:predicted amidophosphoribosyltransferase